MSPIAEKALKIAESLPADQAAEIRAAVQRLEDADADNAAQVLGRWAVLRAKLHKYAGEPLI